MMVKRGVLSAEVEPPAVVMPGLAHKVAADLKQRIEDDQEKKNGREKRAREKFEGSKDCIHTRGLQMGNERKFCGLRE